MRPLQASVRGDGPAVVLLHGQPGGPHDWEPVAQALAAQFTVVVPERPGYGETGGRPRSMAANGEAVAELLDHLDIPSATVVGHSWAGGVGVAMAALLPERVDGLVLVSSVGPDSPISRIDRLFAAPVFGPALSFVGLRLLARLLSVARVRASVAPALDRVDPDYVAFLRATWNGRGVWRTFSAEQRSFVREAATLRPLLESIVIPTTVLVGDDDRVEPPATGAALAGAIPGARLVEVPGAGHLLPREAPEMVAEAIAATARAAPRRSARP